MGKLTIDIVRARVYAVNPNIKILSTEYEAVDKKIKCKCLIDGYEWDALPLNLFRGHGCRECMSVNNRAKRASTIADVKQSLCKITQDIEILSNEYVNNRTMLVCKCKLCGHMWEAKANNLLNKRGCPKCATANTARKLIYSFEYIKKRIYKVNPNILILNQDYLGAHRKIRVNCKICGMEWEATPNLLYRGYGCPRCKESKGERAISLYLKSIGVQFRRQYRTVGCKYKYKLAFDFAVLNDNTVLVFIEYQGQQHYKPMKIFGGIDAFKYQQNNDNIKRKYCIENNIPLIEVPYTIKNINGYLAQQLALL